MGGGLEYQMMANLPLTGFVEINKPDQMRKAKAIQSSLELGSQPPSLELCRDLKAGSKVGKV